jgi:nitric oxide reductase large subunit
MHMDLFQIFVMLALANFIYAFFASKDYEAAFERSYFQGFALLAVAISL